MIMLYAFTGLCAFWWWSAYKKRESLFKYEFENRTTGGVVEFKTYEQSKKHENSKAALTNQMAIAGGLIFLSVLAICFGHAIFH